MSVSVSDTYTDLCQLDFSFTATETAGHHTTAKLPAHAPWRYWKTRREGDGRVPNGAPAHCRTTASTGGSTSFYRRAQSSLETRLSYVLVSLVFRVDSVG